MIDVPQVLPPCHMAMKVFAPTFVLLLSSLLLANAARELQAGKPLLNSFR